ncbi:Tricorn protease [Luteitalea pratensis]|uniref:Tricorn protease homolog n=1 Tax=Luteitalea pratensis TaxID=1855912 RepID=A0A143PG11_LUTPR|nr:S41 family peptidase [Luteitalea pratensis]AMY07522.1 Tricorn protease [Luteitalea pratensis]
MTQRLYSLTLVVRRALGAVAILATIVATASPAAAIDTTDTRMLSQPALSARQIAFIYAGDLYVCDLDGHNVGRLTSDEGIERSPAFSPDGTQLAFSAEYDGNVDVYVVPVAGGVPRRLTWHPGADVVQGFTPDGTQVLFTSPRAVFTGRYTQLFTVPVKGGVEVALPIPNASRGSYNADGTRIAYNPLNPAHLQWKRYRGGSAATIILYDPKTHATEKIAQPATRANDVDPQWLGGMLYFRSDRDGEFNLHRFDPASKQVTRLTSHDDFPVLGLSVAAGRIAYEQAGYLHLFDIASKQARRFTIGIGADLVELRPRYVKGPEWIRAMSVSPSGARIAMEYRGEILTVPAEKGDPRNITATTAVHERAPKWSPDGRSLAYFSDSGGEYALHIRAQDGKGEPSVVRLAGSGFYDAPVWSPDSRHIALRDNGRTLYVLTVATGTISKVVTEPVYRPGAFSDTTCSWSPDSKWLAYTTTSRAQIQSARVWSVDTQASFPVTDGLSDVSEPVFDRNGKYLYLFGSTDAGPVRDWFSQANADMRSTSAIYLVVLKKGEVSPLARESDEEKAEGGGKGEKNEKGEKDEKGEKETGGDAATSTPAATVIDTDGLGARVVALPVPPGDYSGLQSGETGKLFYLRSADGKSSLQQFDLKTRKVETWVPAADAFIVTADAKKLLYRNGTAFHVVVTSKKADGTEGKVNVDALQVRVDPQAEWPQIFDEAWRINRDYFYAANYHGRDWPAMKKKYAQFLPHLAHRTDLARVIQWMASELAVGHSYGGGGDVRRKPGIVPGGLLGADYEVVSDRYRIRKVYGGLNWTPTLRAPLTEPGVDVQAGEYLLAVDGVDLRASTTNLHAPFENTAGKLVELTVGANADGAGSRTVKVVPIESEAALRNRDWVEGNLRKVTEATRGRVAYVYVPNTAGLGHEYFKRYFYPQTGRDAVIVDERFNGGGQVADYYIDLLRRPLVSYWATRHGDPIRTPAAAILGPKVMITDETAGSGGDLLPWMFRKFQLGPIVGKRTWGGLVGILGYPVLMDGGNVTAPNLAIFTDEGWVVENEGVAPDIEVEQTPADVIAGKDPQLERAIAAALDALAKNPVKTPVRPKDPVR